MTVDCANAISNIMVLEILAKLSMQRDYFDSALSTLALGRTPRAPSPLLRRVVLVSNPNSNNPLSLMLDLIDLAF